jgi:hypothetical protein
MSIAERDRWSVTVRTISADLAQDGAALRG